MLILAGFTALIVYLETNFYEIKVKNSTIFHQILGFVLSMLLVFRINSAYDRWWEGRKMWGALVNNTRNLSLKLNALLPEGETTIRANFFTHISNYGFCLKEHLKDRYKEQEIENCETFNKNDLLTAEHKPNFIAGKIYQEVEIIRKKGFIDNVTLLSLNDELKSFTEITGACERIKNTPIPYAYSMFLKKIIFIYVVTMPFTFGVDFGYWSIPLVMFIFYAFTSLELISEEIEDPFGDDSNDLPTDEIAQRIRVSVKEILR
jgi:putative membrane protein